MARQDLSRHQRGIVKRYYENQDTIALTRLQELVSELYLAMADGKKTDRYWKQVRTHLSKTDTPPVVVEKVVSGQDLEALASIVTNAKVTPKKPSAR